MPVYMTQEQCQMFGVAYFGPADGFVSASKMLATKGGDGYDEAHKRILVPLGDQLIRLRRRNGDDNGPGWFTIVDEQLEN